MAALAAAWLWSGSPAAIALTIEEVESRPDIHPDTVTINVAIEAPVVVGGRQAGSVRLPEGSVLPLGSIRDGQVKVVAGGAEVPLAADDTDILERAADLAAEKENAEAARAERQAAAESRAESPAATEEPAEAAPAAEPEQPAANEVAQRISNDLVQTRGRRLAPFDGSELESKKYLMLYFSAAWCGPCLRFTPELVHWYRRHRSHADKFELVFVSSDHDEDKMAEYMTSARMPWPAVAFDKRAASNLGKYGGGGIPCLVVVDERGEVVLHSYEGKTYIGPRKVLEEFTKILRGRS